MWHKMVLAVTLAALAGGCTTMTPEQRRAADEEKCRSYGFTKRNDAFAECLQRLDLDRRAALRQSNDFNVWQPPVVIYRPVPVPVKPG
ncbi:hypothetical protein G6N74_19060 [Mesorhizobium sp. CGMCC 1.15528]|uniref:Lipoprotein n=1 Tax=Mesorhizobium zhangyense TaxID=1776730 RepID=A0A7C9R930_9HYPH|nr:hypothetical protein [Mesorhizobium zhangyense]NGN43174.1 hypothetical protein [Mesorhizobium zhangyense]